MKFSLIVLAIITSLTSPAYAPPLGSASWIVRLDGVDMPGNPYADEEKCFVPRDFYKRETGGDAQCIQIGAK